MGKILDDFYEVFTGGKEFGQFDSRLTKEYENRIQGIKEHLPPEECEQIRDAMFSVLYLGKKEAFGLGFQAAIRLMMELSGEKS
ncbi:MAG: hypothetical protein HFH39_04840 [Lachnospiraceae bacterium]|nr:hypothetical protein [Lachnospiraceae bacterium]